MNGSDPCGNCFHNWEFSNCSKCSAFWNGVEYVWDAFWKCWSFSTEVGFGVGGKGKIGAVSGEAAWTILGDEWTINSDGTFDSIRKSSLGVQVDALDNVSLGVNLEYVAPLEEVQDEALLGHSSAKFDVVTGLTVFDKTLGYSTLDTQDIELGVGIAGYLIMGGGLEISFNLSKFINYLSED